MAPSKSPEKLALFDLDGTLIDDSYHLTDTGISDSVTKAREKGWSVGLSSDTPYDVLVEWRKQLNMNGPIIAEKGAVVESGDELLFNKHVADSVALAKVAIVDYLRDQHNTAVWIGNSTELIRQNRPEGEPGQRSVLINSLSRCSLRFYVRLITPNGEMAIDDSLTQETIEELSRFYPKFDVLEIDNNPNFGLMIVSDGTVSKRSGLETLLDNQTYSRRIMVGNSTGDYIGEDLVEQFAVANADSDYLHMSSIVTKSDLTAGCIEVLDSLN